MGGVKIITTSHELAKELLNKPNDFLTATLNNKEYAVECYQRKATHANLDDGIVHLTLKLCPNEVGNIVRRGVL